MPEEISLYEGVKPEGAGGSGKVLEQDGVERREAGEEFLIKGVIIEEACKEEDRGVGRGGQVQEEGRGHSGEGWGLAPSWEVLLKEEAMSAARTKRRIG